MRRGRAKLCDGHNPRHFLYQLTCNEFALLVARSEGRCERCGIATPRLSIEHDHAAGIWAVRGLVCHRCNITVSAIERGERNLDQATLSYLASPFHRLISATSPGLRPIQHPGTERPRPSRDQRITDRTAAEDLVDEIAASAILGVGIATVREMVNCGRLPRGYGQVFRRVVVERVAILAKPLRPCLCDHDKSDHGLDRHLGQYAGYCGSCSCAEFHPKA